MTFFDSQMDRKFNDLLTLRENQFTESLRQSLEQSLGDADNPGHETSDTKDAAFTQASTDISQARDTIQAAGLADVQSARQRLVHGNFGFCVKCGAQIALARLLAVPETPRCTQCQEVSEKNIHDSSGLKG